MIQRIMHGATLDIATPNEVERLIERTRKHQVEERDRHKGIVNLDATGAGSLAVRVSRQYNWKMERVAIGGAGAVNALVVIFDSNSGSDADMLEVIQLGTAGRYTDAFSNSLWIGAGTRMIVSVTGGVANGQVTFNFQVQMLPVPE